MAFFGKLSDFINFFVQARDIVSEYYLKSESVDIQIWRLLKILELFLNHNISINLDPGDTLSMVH